VFELHWARKRVLRGLRDASRTVGDIDGAAPTFLWRHLLPGSRVNHALVVEVHANCIDDSRSGVREQRLETPNPPRWTGVKGASSTANNWCNVCYVLSI
jgi:hypothetical protein